MDIERIEKILEETAYIRTGGSAEELKCAEYIADKCEALGVKARLEPFEIDLATVRTEKLTADGVDIPCKAYLCSGSADIEAELYYLRTSDAYSLEQCRGKIVLADKRMGFWKYQDILKNGAVGFITYCGNLNTPDRDINTRTLRSEHSKAGKIPGVMINAKDALDMVKRNVKRVRITIAQDEYKATSHNVVLDLPGEREEYIVLSAHYDSTALSVGSYDNMSGSVGILGVAEHFAKHPHRYGLRFVWCGSEELGLLGSIAYCAEHREELEKAVLNINLDMIGSVMGRFFACCTAEERLVSYIQYFSEEYGFGIEAAQDVYSSDSTSFADAGVPAISVTRDAPSGTGSIHDRYDTMALLSGAQMAYDIDLLNAFVARMANAAHCPVKREIPEKVKDKIDAYMDRKRDDS